MNTCQTSTKTDILIIVLLKPPSWSIRQRQDHHNSSLRTDQSGEGQADKTVISHTCVVDRLLKLSCILLVRIIY